MTAHTCRTCAHLVSRPQPDQRAANRYCGHPDLHRTGSAVVEWVSEHKPPRRFPVSGARDCPGWLASGARAAEVNERKGDGRGR